MQSGPATELILIRHAPALSDGRLCGRTDVAADLGNAVMFAAVRAALGQPDRILISPALRCRQTAGALWPDLPEPQIDAGLWEQNFGEWEGMPYSELPDLGRLSLAELAVHSPPGGESFAELCERVMPVLSRAATSGVVVVVAHAGVVRAGLALALGSVPQALAFDVSPLSLTRLRRLGPDAWSIGSVNWIPG